MRPAPFIFVLLFAFLAVTVTPCANAAVSIVLKNGNPLSADSYHIEKNKLFLKYPLGEVEIPLSQVESIKTDGGEAILFHEEGRRAEKAEKPVQAKRQPASRQPDKAEIKKWLDERPEARQQPYQPQTEAEMKADAFIDRYFAASPQEQDKMEAEVEEVINQLFNEDGAKEANGAPER